MSDKAGGSCRRCARSDWKVGGMTEPILAVECQSCGAVEWIGFLPAEWVQFVAPCQLGDRNDEGGRG